MNDEVVEKLEDVLNVLRDIDTKLYWTEPIFDQLDRTNRVLRDIHNVLLDLKSGTDK